MIEVLYTLATLFGLYDVAEGSARLIAALLLVLHPVHEQSLNFRGHFNARVLGWFDREPVRPEAEKLYRMPLGKKMNALQAIALATVFPALALFGPWWALPTLFTFYLADSLWTHAKKEIPGGWSALLAFVAVNLTLPASYPEVNSSPWLCALSAVAGLMLLAFPWIMAYRRVRSSGA